MRKLLLLAAVSALAFSGHNAMAANLSETGHINARIVDPVSVTEDVQLNFGAILPGANTVTLDTGNSRSATVTSNLVGVGYSTAKSGKWTITGPVGAKPNVTTSDSATLTLVGGEATMLVDNFTNNSTNSPISGAGATGEVEVGVGAKLHVEDGQAPGNYEGTYTVMISY